ncbi:hypothetical protein CHU95_08215 [Niveispirillum lacus]|uniref:Uncharacterized protein n=1 Tax=Niveispirillum lacus TaxID=1981099 RepID=A0A255Z160_9PROT|nr:hypothetical protein [Niveispirillum lacus]OYQ35208.1 hypothetical protein CHU95_08215 [Niveispirillum lacus]
MGRDIPKEYLGQPCADHPVAGSGDCCRSAVTRAYRDLRSRGVPDAYCLDAALAVYQWHHPEAEGDTAAAIVGSWVTTGTLH